MINSRRIYEPLESDDGYRILVDRLWPRGVSKERAQIDLWFKEVTPSTALRKWYGHKAERWEEFKELYREELSHKKEELEKIRELEREHGNVTLLYAAKKREQAHVLVLLEELIEPFDRFNNSKMEQLED